MTNENRMFRFFFASEVDLM